MRLTIIVEKMHENAIMPVKGSEFSAGFDIMTPKDYPDTIIKPGEWVAVKTGLKMAPTEKNVVLMACSRSGLALKNGITSHISPGIIDSDYRGEIMGVVRNNSNVDFTLTALTKFMQLVTVIIPETQLLEGTVDSTDRGAGGFGSTGMTVDNEGNVAVGSGSTDTKYDEILISPIGEIFKGPLV